MARDKLLTVRVEDEDLRLLEELAAHEERSASDVVRRLIRRAHAEVFGQPRTSAEAMALRGARAASASAMVLSEGLSKRRPKRRGKVARSRTKKK